MKFGYPYPGLSLEPSPFLARNMTFVPGTGWMLDPDRWVRDRLVYDLDPTQSLLREFRELAVRESVRASQGMENYLHALRSFPSFQVRR